MAQYEEAKSVEKYEHWSRELADFCIDLLMI